MPGLQVCPKGGKWGIYKAKTSLMDEGGAMDVVFLGLCKAFDIAPLVSSSKTS